MLTIMKSFGRNAFYFTCLFISSWSFAVTCPPSHGANENLFELKNYLVPVVIKGPTDDRKPISQNAAITKEQYKQSLTSTGMVYCPGSKFGVSMKAQGNVALVNDMIVTVAHVFFDKFGNPTSRYKDFRDCYFTNYADKPPVRYKFDVVKLGSESADVYKMPSRDFAVIKLKKPVVGAIPYRVDLSQTPIAKGEKLTTITNKYKRNGLGIEPNSQVCTAIKTFKANAQGGNGYGTDCDVEPGDSAGIQLVKLSDGSLAIKGLIVGDSENAKEGCLPDDKDCFDASVELTGPFLETLKELVPPEVLNLRTPSQNETLSL